MFEFAINCRPEIALDFHPLFVLIGPRAKLQGERLRTQGCNVGLRHRIFDHSGSFTRGLLLIVPPRFFDLHYEEPGFER